MVDSSGGLVLNVIDESLIEQAVREDRVLPVDPTKKHRSLADELGAKDNSEIDEPVVFNEVRVLRLSFKNILTISNLQGFEALHTLCLDNNAIEKYKALIISLI